MDKTINKIISGYIELDKENYSEVEVAYIFGPYAKGNSNKDSDIDVALIFKKLDPSRRFDLQVKLMLLASRVDTRIEPHPISHDDFYSENPFVAEIKRTGFELSEKLMY